MIRVRVPMESHYSENYKRNNMKICALSDLHGTLVNINEPIDLVILCGDVCPVYCHTTTFQEEWLHDEFIEWINSLPLNEGGKVVMCAGNHDFWFEKATKEYIDNFVSLTNGRLIYLCDSEYTHKYGDKEYRIYGTPYCKKFGDWAFMEKYPELKQRYSHIPEGLDILFTHDAAQIAALGLIKEGRWAGEDAGNVELADAVVTKKPKYYFCGHIHSGTHNLMKYGDTFAANVAIMNEDYYPKHNYLTVEL